MLDLLDSVAGWLQEHALVPMLWQAGLIEWEEVSQGWAVFAIYGVVQVALTYAICVPLERWRPVERWPDARAVATDIVYTLISRVGVLPLVTFVAFYRIQVDLTGFLTDHGWVQPTLERFLPGLLGRPALSFFLYAVILDFSDYWRHRLSHVFQWWWALHSLHHAQRQMTFWSDDRNHLLDDIIAALWFGAVATLIGVPPLQFPVFVLGLRFLESLSHANARVHFGLVGERLLVSPRFHRAHHGVLATGRRSVNYGAILPVWDIVFGTADFSPAYVRTGDPTGSEALAAGGYVAQQWAGVQRLLSSTVRTAPSARHGPL